MLQALNRCILLTLLAIFSVLAYADTSSSKPNPNEPSVFLKSLDNSGSALIPPNNLTPAEPIKTAPQPLSQLEQLENTQAQLQAALVNLEQQSNQLQANLSVLTQQLGRISPIQKTPEEIQRLEQLRKEHQQIQDALTILFQQQTALQTRTAALNQQLTQLRETLTAAQSTTPTPAATPTVEAAPIQEVNPSNIVTPAKPENAAIVATPALVTPPPLLPENTTVSSTTTTQTTNVPAATPASTTTVTTIPTATSNIPNATPIAKPVSKLTVSAKKTLPTKQVRLKKELSTASWMENPTTILRVGGGFIVLALLLLLFFFWPRKKQTTVTINTEKELYPNLYPNQESSEKIEEAEDLDLVPEYDFLNTDDAIPTRLNLARGYLEMHKYAEAREAINPIFEKGNPSQKNEAEALLREIEEAENAQL